jgi:hypothetical protein
MLDLRPSRIATTARRLYLHLPRRWPGSQPSRRSSNPPAANRYPRRPEHVSGGDEAGRGKHAPHRRPGEHVRGARGDEEIGIREVLQAVHAGADLLRERAAPWPW